MCLSFGIVLASTRYKDAVILLWPEFSANFNFYWTRRNDIYEQWRSRETVKAVVNLPSSAGQSSVDPSRRLNTPLVRRSSVDPPGVSDMDGSARVLEAELVEVSERLRQARYSVDEERQKRHMLRDELDEVRRQMDEERARFRDGTKQLVILEEDKLTHDIQVSRLRETVEQTVSAKEALQLDLDRCRMQLYHAKQKYEAALSLAIADSEALRKRAELMEVTFAAKTAVSPTEELNSQNAVLRQIVEKYRRNLPQFADTVDRASSAAFESAEPLDSEFLNALMEALDKAKFLNKQLQAGIEAKNWTPQTWQDLCAGWREAVCELCDLFAQAHRTKAAQSRTTT